MLNVLLRALGAVCHTLTPVTGRSFRALTIAASFTLGLSGDLGAQLAREAALRHGQLQWSVQGDGNDLLPRLRVTNQAREATKWRKVAQVTGGFLGATVGGMAAWAVWDDPEGADRRVKGDAGYNPNANTAYAIGSYAGSTLLVYLIGKSDGSRGSLLSTAIGSSLASIPLLFGRHEPYLPILGIVLAAPLQAIGGTVAYQLTRRAGE